MGMVRGDIYLINLDPTIGSEIQKTRPCVIVSPPEIHNHLRTALIAPMTTGSRPAPFRIPVDFQGKSGLILPEQIRVVDKARLVKKLGELDSRTLSKLLSVLQEMFAE
ncbi:MULTISPECIES: type II toxin-antitoxin system PemK/MazF family toxin [unclassified Mannheimia]|uniref:type II toxin-antitoxin system PemK/MazF family toxin n=1 Tax=unclassified Mannheimia TaxID=2645054 RepID=UPI00359D1AEE